MAQLIFAILFSQLAWSLELVPLQEIRWNSKTEIQKTKLGGISAILIRDQNLYLLSDDRGLVAEPRFYSFKLKYENKTWKLKDEKVHFLSMPKNGKLKQVLDTESMVFFADGFLIGSEGDNNKKPRVPPRIFAVDSLGRWQFDLRLPEKLLPELTGQQKKGVSNNFAFEAMTISPDQEVLWYVTERPLVQDNSLKDEKAQFRLFQMKKIKDQFVADEEFYLEGLPSSSGEGISLVQGWTDMLHREGQKFWILHRALRLQPTKILDFECRLAELDFSRASRVGGVAELPKAKNLTAALVKNTIDLGFKGRPLGNCEGMVVGPAVEGYKSTLWVVTDNNFSKSEDTAIYIFGVKE